MQFWFLKALLIVFCLMLIGFGVKHIYSGRIFVGYGERYLYGRVWVRRTEDPVLFWTITGGLVFLGVFFLFLGLSIFLFNPLAPENLD